MTDHANSNGTTPDPWEDARKLARGVLGGLKETFDLLGSSMNTSSRPSGVTPSSSPNGSKSESKPTETDESPAWSSSSQTKASSSTSSKPNDDLIERDREGTLTINFSTYGTKEQKAKLANTVIRDLNVRGYGVIHAALDGEEIHLAE